MKALGFATIVTRERIHAGLLAGCLLLCYSPAECAGKGPNVDLSHSGHGAETPATSAIEQLRLSDGLADFGERTADPVALVEAAKIRRLLPAALRGPKNAGANVRTWESLLIRAAQLAGSNPAVAGMIADVRAYKDRDIPPIAADVSLLHKQIKQNRADRAEVRFKAGELASVYVRAEATANLDLYVYDELNNLICAGAGGGQDAHCRWRPRWDGPYLIDVHNNNDFEVEYVLAINRELVAR